MVSVDSRAGTPIRGTDDAKSPTISPDGEMVAFAKLDGTDPVNFYPVYALHVAPIGSGSPSKVPVAVRPVQHTGAKRLFYISWSPTAAVSAGPGQPEPQPD